MGGHLNHRIFFVAFLLLITGVAACIKEYSYEGGSLTPVPDTLLQPPVLPSPDTVICAQCIGKDKFEEDRWSFRESNLFVCGNIDTAIVGPDRDVFTFFGPSACTIDTNFVISAFLGKEKLDRDRQNLVISQVIFYVSVNAGSVYWLHTKPGTPFTMTILTYDHQTRLATGSFNGTLYKQDGSTTLLRDSRFQVRLM